MNSGAPDRVRAKRAPGAIERALTRMFVREARVFECERLSEHFYAIGFEGEQLRGAAWAPGQKLQLFMESGSATRTYTPTFWDAARGRTRILAYAHGDGPGSEWARGAAVGAPCRIFGPRASLDLTRATSPALLVGDETSIGLAMALRGNGDRLAQCVFEVHSAVESVPVLAQLGLEDALVFERVAHSVHLDSVVQAIRARLQKRALVLTGNATSIQAIRKQLSVRAVRAPEILTKAYWAPGKRGLD